MEQPFFDYLLINVETMATLGLSKVFILDKYFTELQKFWETEKKLQGKLLHALIQFEFGNIFSLCFLHIEWDI